MTGSVAAAGTWQHTFNLTAPAGGIALAEVVVRSGDDEAFARTNFAVLPAFDYQAGADSMFGIANYPWLQRPSADAVLDLWQRAGISVVRIAYDGGPGLPPSAFDARGMQHNIELQPSLTVTDTEAAAWAADKLAVAAGAGAGYFEVGNELNRPFNTGDAAQAYLDKVMRPVFDRRAVTGDTVKLMNNGLAGMDKPWVENFIAGRRLGSDRRLRVPPGPRQLHARLHPAGRRLGHGCRRHLLELLRRAEAAQGVDGCARWRRRSC